MIHDRKLDHIEISLTEQVDSRLSNGFEDILPVHRALPELSLEKIELSTEFLGRRLSAPIIIAGMTGGHEKAKKINESLAQAAQELGIAMGVGSQRAALEREELSETFAIARKAAPEAFLIANLGAVQFAGGYTLEEAEKAVEMIDADALAIHLNPLHEALQPEGDRDFRGCLKAISELRELKVPIIVKETGAGISKEDAALLEKAGVSAIDVGGAGGTSFAAVESYREGVRRELAERFLDWGIPTAISTIEAVSSTSLPIISTGGVRSGVEVAKALALGAIAAGVGRPFLREAVKGPEHVRSAALKLMEELRIAMFLMGARDVQALRSCSLVITGRTREWMDARGIDYKRYARRGG